MGTPPGAPPGSPSVAAPWRADPDLRERFHPEYPDDLQVIVHDGDPRRTGRDPELCWVRVHALEGATPRPGAPPANVYVGELLHPPHALLSVRMGDRLKLLASAGTPHPLQVTDVYLADRGQWTITPCDRCGARECFDPPSDLARTRFPEAPPGAQIQAFTAFCSLCGGVQQLQRADAAR